MASTVVELPRYVTPATPIEACTTWYSMCGTNIMRTMFCVHSVLRKCDNGLFFVRHNTSFPHPPSREVDTVGRIRGAA